MNCKKSPQIKMSLDMGHKDHLLIVAEKSDCVWQCRYAKQVTIWGILLWPMDILFHLHLCH